MKNFIFAFVIATVSAASFSVATAADDDVIHGRTATGIVAALKAQGVPVDSVEEWGGFVRVWSTAPSGAYAMQLFDPNTLQPAVR